MPPIVELNIITSKTIIEDLFKLPLEKMSIIIYIKSDSGIPLNKPAIIPLKVNRLALIKPQTMPPNIRLAMKYITENFEISGDFDSRNEKKTDKNKEMITPTIQDIDNPTIV